MLGQLSQSDSAVRVQKTKSEVRGQCPQRFSTFPFAVQLPALDGIACESVAFRAVQNDARHGAAQEQRGAFRHGVCADVLKRQQVALLKSGEFPLANQHVSHRAKAAA